MNIALDYGGNSAAYGQGQACMVELSPIIPIWGGHTVDEQAGGSLYSWLCFPLNDLP